ncbi:MAG: hypothetical protein HY315_07880 [Acidobacteria bacterium]|nr:hypothetical protein [Acidobacteriota bacterium]
MNRRQFLAELFLLRRPVPSVEGMQVQVLENFRLDSGTSMLLVHHTQESQRSQFSRWLQQRDRTEIQLFRGGQMITGRIFRMKMCLDRGLILLSNDVSVKAKEVLTIAPPPN